MAGGESVSVRRLPTPIKSLWTFPIPVFIFSNWPRRLSDVHPLHSQRHPSFSATSRCALTPTGLTSAQIFFPPLSTPHTASFVNKSTSKRKMDEYVPSLGLRSQFTASPAPSMYDKSHVNTLCGNSRFSSTSMDSAVSDEVYGLDDNLEDGTLAALLTQDVINTLQQATNLNTQSDFLWSTKLGQSVTAPLINDQLSPGSDLNHINLEQDVPFSNDLLNLDQNDSKSTYTNFDSVCLGMNDFSNQSRYSGVLINSPAPSIVQTTRDKTRSFETLSSPVNSGSQNTPRSDISSNLSKTSPARSNFISRPSHPQVGVAAVIKAKYDEMAFPEKESEKLLEPGQQTLNTQRLLNTKSTQIQLKQEILSPTETNTGGQCVVSGVTDFTRVVPSLGSAKRSHDGLIKTEPKSPKSLSGSVTKEESTEEKWKDIENFIYSPDDESSKKRKRYESGSSNDDDDDDDDDDRSSSCEDKDDDSDDDYSDIDADLVNIRPNECESLVALGKKQKQFFWQYNVQSKGPKGTRLKLAVESPTDPHVLNEFEDPVFDECNTAIAGIRHGGKARKGDGNEITPNPRKLFMIGHQLLRLNSQINACQLGMDVPLARRNESRKEKNKLASRACRLKKKAQHEANKIKLYGLEQEHSQLNSVLRFIWPHIRERAKVLLGLTEKSASLPPTCTPLTSLLESQISQHLKSMIAGHTVEYVNSVILKVESGDNSGGLNIKRSHRT